MYQVQVEDADHGMALKGSGKETGTKALRRRTGEVSAAWLRERDEGRRAMVLRWDGARGQVVSEGWEEMGEGEEAVEGDEE